MPENISQIDMKVLSVDEKIAQQFQSHLDIWCSQFIRGFEQQSEELKSKIERATAHFEQLLEKADARWYAAKTVIPPPIETVSGWRRFWKYMTTPSITLRSPLAWVLLIFLFSIQPAVMITAILSGAGCYAFKTIYDITKLDKD